MERCKACQYTGVRRQGPAFRNPEGNSPEQITPLIPQYKPSIPLVITLHESETAKNRCELTGHKHQTGRKSTLVTSTRIVVNSLIDTLPNTADRFASLRNGRTEPPATPSRAPQHDSSLRPPLPINRRHVSKETGRTDRNRQRYNRTYWRQRGHVSTSPA